MPRNGRMRFILAAFTVAAFVFLFAVMIYAQVKP
jgi:hypothetical protein